VTGEAEPLPSYSMPRARVQAIAMDLRSPLLLEPSTGEASDARVRVCVLDSGVDGSHPAVGGVARSVAVIKDDEGYAQVLDDDEGDVFGHGTACAGIIRSLAPMAEISSARVLGPDNRGSAGAMVAGLRWAVDQGFDVINMSLSTTNTELRGYLYEVADDAYFKRTLLVASAHNAELRSWPWTFSSVISVGTHDGDDPLEFFYNPSPPVEFFARGMDLDVAWLDGARMRTSGNSFATAHMSGICARVMSAHPGLAPFAVKSLLQLSAANVTRAPA
jgi:subtilisin family serine protease